MLSTTWWTCAQRCLSAQVFQPATSGLTRSNWRFRCGNETWSVLRNAGDRWNLSAWWHLVLAQSRYMPYHQRSSTNMTRAVGYIYQPFPVNITSHHHITSPQTWSVSSSQLNVWLPWHRPLGVGHIQKHCKQPMISSLASTSPWLFANNSIQFSLCFSKPDSQQQQIAEDLKGSMMIKETGHC